MSECETWVACHFPRDSIICHNFFAITQQSIVIFSPWLMKIFRRTWLTKVRMVDEFLSQCCSRGSSRIFPFVMIRILFGSWCLIFLHFLIKFIDVEAPRYNSWGFQFLVYILLWCLYLYNSLSLDWPALSNS